MSADSVDDLHYAEDIIGTLRAALRKVVDIDDAGDLTDLIDEIRPALDEAEAYCRPTCGHLDFGECHDDCCGCPCDPRHVHRRSSTSRRLHRLRLPRQRGRVRRLPRLLLGRRGRHWHPC